MRDEKIVASWNKINPGGGARERMLNNILGRARSGGINKRRESGMFKNLKILIPAAACAVIALAITIPLLNGGGDFKLRLSDGVKGGDFELRLSDGVKVSYLDEPPSVESSGSLVYLTEEEMFAPYWHGQEIIAFEGVVKKVENIVLSFGSGWHHNNYRAIAYIEVGEVFRGGVEPGETVSVLLHSPVGDGTVRSAESHISSQMYEGTPGIFMPVKYSEDATWEENGKTLYLQEIAEYGFLDGERFAFLETPDGLAFARFAYESVSNAVTMDEIRQYVRDMLAAAQ